MIIILIYSYLHFNIFKINFSIVCPAGFQWLDQQGCAAVIQEPSSKSEALQKCRDKNPYANLMMPKTAYQQLKLEQLVEGVSNASLFFLGMTKTAGYWYWDDGTAVFLKCKKFN
jgi:hypothetical protein